MQDVAKRAGVTKQTVSNVLSGRVPVRPITAARVREAIAELGYVPNLVARSLATGSSRTVGMFVPTVSTAFYAGLVERVEDVLEEHGYRLLLCTTRRDGERARRHLAGLTSRSVDALLIAGDEGLTDHLSLLSRTRFPVVLCAWETRAPARFPVVTIDYEHGGYLAGRHLRSLGHEQVTVLASPAHGPRVSGFRRAFAEDGLDVPDSAVYLAPEPSFRGGMSAAEEAMRAHPSSTALFATHDVLASGALEAARGMRRSVPGDLSVVAHDDTPDGVLAPPALTSVALPSREMAREAIRLLLREIEGAQPADPQRRLLLPRLIARDSTSSLA
ncbi:LacI family DNA-binding transcriptional regulator [Streptomyces sp. HNM0663]|uniref:LacI family DNA-binding transcriptional regulator n=1 Tax=Streptomyces chengmaiensis TaxID=3040919 RepID=A0ABT6HZH8_9ACTN|nr:LacI family DNA-binding transcriptional regulator [Streptomyces chengmaiensis]MDH2394123.1 LacI family DNA-binding transcriptional regulator [Streptomyces chengmaiensis]